jgi:hypothetical protein
MMVVLMVVVMAMVVMNVECGYDGDGNDKAVLMTWCWWSRPGGDEG